MRARLAGIWRDDGATLDCVIAPPAIPWGHKMKVYFIGAGPGDPELLTLKAQRMIAACPVCLYAGSLVPAEVVAGAPEGARVIDTAPLPLEDTHAEILAARQRGEDVARVHSGDPSLYGAIAEQIRLLKRDGIAYEIIPGVPSAVAAAAACGIPLTRRMTARRVQFITGHDASEFDLYGCFDLYAQK